MRHNMPVGKLTTNSWALKRMIILLKSRVNPLPVDPAVLEAGTNTITATVYQCAPNSSDMIFDLAVRVDGKTK